MEERRKLIIVLIIVVSVLPIASSAFGSLTESLDPDFRPIPNNSANLTDSGYSVYLYDEGDHDATIWLTVENTHNRSHTIRAEITPILEGGAELPTKTVRGSAEAGEIIRMEKEWRSATNKEEQITGAQIRISVCDTTLLHRNCTEAGVYENDW